MPKLQFTEYKATDHKAIVVSLDLAGFSSFCNQPDAATSVPRLAKHFFDVLNLHFRYDSDATWTFFDTKKLELADGQLPEPNFLKFTGDGALMFWILENSLDFPQSFCDRIVSVMRQFQKEIASSVPSWEKHWRVHKLPKSVRVGIATGTVYALRPPHMFTSFTSPVDFVGYCVNLAVRLQSYCPELGFLVHGHLHSKLPGMGAGEALKMKGAQAEPVLYFEEDATRVPQSELKKKFTLSQ